MRLTSVEVNREPGAQSAQEGDKFLAFDVEVVSDFTKFGTAILARLPRLCAFSFCIVG